MSSSEKLEARFASIRKFELRSSTGRKAYSQSLFISVSYNALQCESSIDLLGVIACRNRSFVLLSPIDKQRANRCPYAR
jgi:hypothetical protein